MQHQDDFTQALEIIPSRYYFAQIKRPECLRTSQIAADNICYCIDAELVYEPFYSDFGPLNLGKAFRFCETTKHLLQEAERRNKRLYLFCGAHANQKANAAVLVGIFQVLYLERSPEEAYARLRHFEPFTPFRDPSCGSQTFNLQVEHVVRGIACAAQVGLINARSGVWRFDLQEYEHYEQVENGDLNWIVPGKFVAFSGPAAVPNRYVGFREMVPEDYWDYFRSRGVKAVIRLNKKVYEAKRFTDGGFVHHEMYFPDGSCPTEPILRRFLDTVESEPGAFAVHCKAGLGRTGVLICCYMMKHFRLTAEEVIGYIRVVRPGSVIGPQQNFLQEAQARMWAEGDAMRARQAAAAASTAAAASPAAFGKAMAKLAAAGTWASDGSEQPSTPTTPGVRIGAYYPQSPAAPARAASQRSGAADPGQLSTRMGGMQLHALPVAAPYRTSSGGSTGSGRSSSTSRRSSTPQRTSSSGGAAPAANSGATRAAGSSILLQGRPGTTGTYSRAPAPGPAARSASADRSKDRCYSSAAGSSPAISLATSYAALGGLRSTLHTETTALASRPKTIPERVSQSAQFLSGLMLGQQQQQDAAATKSGVARVLAPNGQPRKVAAALLSAAGGLASPAALSALVDMEAQPGARSSRTAWGGR